jgi:hypothetical protein
MTLGSYHNQAAMTAVDVINEGRDLVDWIVTNAAEQCRDVDFHAHCVLDNLYSLNAAGDRVVNPARQKLLVEKSIPARIVRLAAE